MSRNILHGLRVIFSTEQATKSFSPVGKKKNLSDVATAIIPGAKDLRIGMVTSMWNPEVTDSLHAAAKQHLLDSGIEPGNIIEERVPGSYELPLAAQFMLERDDIDGVVCLGCIIQGETRHFDFIADAVAHGIMQVNLNYNSPVSFGVLTTNDQQQALERSGGKHGNKGIEAASALLSMLKLKVTLGLI
jgi:6,7-dimethyl-8-ribityllumazine synthase